MKQFAAILTALLASSSYALETIEPLEAPDVQIYAQLGLVNTDYGNLTNDANRGTRLLIGIEFDEPNRFGHKLSTEFALIRMGDADTTTHTRVVGQFSNTNPLLEEKLTISNQDVSTTMVSLGGRYAINKGKFNIYARFGGGFIDYDDSLKRTEELFSGTHPVYDTPIAGTQTQLTTVNTTDSGFTPYLGIGLQFDINQDYALSVDTQTTTVNDESVTNTAASIVLKF